MSHFQSNASKLLLAIMESRHDSENAERVLMNMSNMAGGPRQLVSLSLLDSSDPRHRASLRDGQLLRSHSGANEAADP